ncbi:MAG: DUF3291 domain-containing protein [Haliscomenobacter sp.]|nr:DUF3291 domain-containing protein [Haliscomenobacter sp.]
MVTFTLFRLNGWKNRWWGFRQMGLAPEQLARVKGLAFFKMLGAGAGNGFSIFPDFGTYCLLGVWQDDEDARRFFDTHPLFREFTGRSNSYQTFFLETIQAHGAWDGRQPFEGSAAMLAGRPIAVITRARIRWKQLWRFWTFVPPVSASINRHQEGLLFAIGIGELPLIQQATFSIWRSPEAMKQYAYQSRLHQEVIKKTRELGWYSEELFARFQPAGFEGSGENPLEGLSPDANFS